MNDAPQTPQQPEETAAQQAEKPAAKAPEERKNMNLDDLGNTRPRVSDDATTGADSDAGLEAVYDIPVRVSAVLGETHMQIHQLLKLGRGAVVPLDRKVGEAIDIYVNDRLVARGEVVIMDDKLGVTMTEIVKSAK